MIIQERTGRIGFGHCLHKLGVPGYELGQCSCEKGLETARHVLLKCRLEAGRRLDLKESLGGRLDFTKLLNTEKGGLDS